MTGKRKSGTRGMRYNDSDREEVSYMADPAFTLEVLKEYLLLWGTV
jgi:hypothetical protein